MSENFKKVIIKSFSNNYLLKVEENRIIILEENNKKKLIHFSGMLQLLMMKLIFIQMNHILVLVKIEKHLMDMNL